MFVNCRKTVDELEDNNHDHEEIGEAQQKDEERKTKIKPGHKPRWCSKALDNFIDIVFNSSFNKTKIRKTVRFMKRSEKS